MFGPPNVMLTGYCGTQIVPADGAVRQEDLDARSGRHVVAPVGVDRRAIRARIEAVGRLRRLQHLRLSG